MTQTARTLALVLAPILPSSAPAPAPVAEEAVVVAYMLGQSNCWGQGSTYAQITDPAYGQAIEGAFIWDKIAGSTPHDPVDDGAWLPLTTGYGFQNPPGSNPDAVGAEMELAHRLRAMYGLPVYIVKLARGGSSLYEDPGDLDWSADSDGELLDTWREAYHRPAIEALYAQGKTPKLVGLLWAQGASDAQAGAPSSAPRRYKRNLRKLFDELRAEIGIDDAAIAIQRVTNLDDDDYPELGRVRNAQAAAGNSDPDAAWFDADTREAGGELLFEKVDDEHFDGNGQVDMGAATAVIFRVVIDGRPLPTVPRPE